MPIDHSSYTIDELALCKLIAHELSEGPHSVEEIYGMLILILRMKDQEQVVDTPAPPNVILQMTQDAWFKEELHKQIDKLNNADITYRNIMHTIYTYVDMQRQAVYNIDYSTLPIPPLGG